jgi:hypothetical protein
VELGIGMNEIGLADEILETINDVKHGVFAITYNNCTFSIETIDHFTLTVNFSMEGYEMDGIFYETLHNLLVKTSPKYLEACEHRMSLKFK